MIFDLTNEEKIEILTKVINQNGLRRFDTRVSLMYLICTQFDLTPDFIREYRDMVNWKAISTEQQIPDTDFLREFKDYLNWDYLGKCGRFIITEEQKHEFKEYYDQNRV